ncbi:MAG: S-layer homology domain-containing protein [Firmicutes bacterium]|nr:S-layer homology domain-containing protein [Bacillota bacterium]
MKRRILSSLMALMLVFGLLPATALAEGEAGSTAKTIYVDAVNGDDTQTDVGTTADKAYQSLEKAVTAAASGDTIQLGEGNYTLYNVSSEGHTKSKDLTFVGRGADKTGWNIGAEVPDPKHFGTEYNGDYSFDGAGTITFKNMTLQSAKQDYLGFIRANHTVVDNCTINGKTFYWGYKSATFKNTTFNCPSGDYALWTYSSPTMTFDHCTFNSFGKVINVYTDYCAGKQDITVNFKDCAVTNTGLSFRSKQVLNVNDSNMGNFKYILNISGNNMVSGVPYDKTTCSRLFGFGGKATSNNKGKTVVKFGDIPVWKDGDMVDEKAYHNDGVTVDGVSYNNGVDGANDSLYAEGYKDNAFTTVKGEWTKNPNGTKTRTVTKTCNYCGYHETTTETAPADPIDWDVSKSKTATQLNTNTWTSDVTLSLPSAEENLASDVVFVLDGSSSANTDVVKKSLDLLDELKTAADDSGAAVKVCVVKFKRQAYKSDWFDLSKDFDAIQTAMETKYSGGTNIHAGLLAGQEALEEHTNVAAGRKYLILVSDGSTYLYSKDGNWASDTPFTRSYYPAEPYNAVAGGFWDNAVWEPNSYSDVNVPRPKTTSDVVAWQAYLADVEARNAESNGDNYDYHCDYDLNFNQGKPSDDFKSQPCVKRSANNRDMAFYYANQAWQAIKNAGYNAYSIATKDGMAGAGNADDSHCFMNYLNEGKSLDFADIQKEILYAVSAGSTVTDTIGEKFTFGGVDSFTLKVGTEEINGVKDTSDENTVNFGEKKDDGKYPYTVTYTPDTKTFVWTINENVSNFAPVQLTYTVKLTTPETDPGTYGTEDLKGENLNIPAEKALYTNESAVLNAKNSAGAPVKEQVFPKPSVSYTVKSSGGGGGGSTTTYYYLALKKVDAQDGHALSSAQFGLYQDGKQLATATSDRNGLVMFTLRSKNYKSLYCQELTAPEGYVMNKDKIAVNVNDLTTSRTTAEKNAETVRNYRGVTPDLLNDADHFAYVIGYPDGAVRPQGNITRAETATIFFRLLKDAVRDGNLLTSNAYQDVASSYWANTAVSTMTGLGILQGRDSATFDPNAPITRAEFAAICARFDTGKSSGTQTFSDIRGHWAQDYIERAAELGWVKGFEDGTFRPDTYITRAQAMTMINRVLNRLPEDESDLLAGMNTWPDCNPGDWFYLAVQEATNSHAFTHKAGNYETWTGMNQNPDWTRYEH